MLQIRAPIAKEVVANQDTNLPNVLIAMAPAQRPWRLGLSYSVQHVVFAKEQGCSLANLAAIAMAKAKQFRGKLSLFPCLPAYLMVKQLG